MQAVSAFPPNVAYTGDMPAGRPSKHERSGFGARLFKARQQAGFSQAQIAGMLGVSQQTYAGWERKTTALRPEHIARLADALNVSPDYLLGRNTAPPRRSGPTGKARRAFEQVSRLPRRRQEKILEVVDALIAQKARSGAKR